MSKFNIEDYEFSDGVISMDRNGDLCIKHEEWTGHLDGWRDADIDLTLTKQDAIAIAKHFGLIDDTIFNELQESMQQAVEISKGKV